jgi:uncharacterized repeat protein (TIGR01451 family)
VSGDQQDPDVLDNTAPATLNVSTSADLVTIKQGRPSWCRRHRRSHVSNSGLRRRLRRPRRPAAGGIVVTRSPHPSYVALVVAGQPLTRQLETSPAAAQVAIAYTVDSAFPGPQLVNTASASSVTPDPDLTNNQSVFTSGTGAQADLIISKVQTPIPPVAGAVVSWDLRADNSGPSAAVGVVITDTLPGGLTGISVPAGCTLLVSQSRAPSERSIRAKLRHVHDRGDGPLTRPTTRKSPTPPQ